MTKDAKNVVRFFAGRTHEQMAGNDVVDTFAGVTPLTTTDVYRDKAGNLTTIITPPTTAALAPLQVAEDISQPFIDEYILGFRKQFTGQIAIDVTGQRRSYKHQYGLVDINGIYPSAPFQPFGGFGLIDPNRGIILQERNNTWSDWVVRRAVGRCRQEYLEQLPVHGRCKPAVAAPVGHVEPHRSGALHPTRRLRQ